MSSREEDGEDGSSKEFSTLTPLWYQSLRDRHSVLRLLSQPLILFKWTFGRIDSTTRTLVQDSLKSLSELTTTTEWLFFCGKTRKTKRRRKVISFESKNNLRDKICVMTRKAKCRFLSRKCMCLEMESRMKAGDEEFSFCFKQCVFLRRKGWHKMHFLRKKRLKIGNVYIIMCYCKNASVDSRDSSFVKPKVIMSCFVCRESFALTQQEILMTFWRQVTFWRIRGRIGSICCRRWCIHKESTKRRDVNNTACKWSLCQSHTSYLYKERLLYKNYIQFQFVHVLQNILVFIVDSLAFAQNVCLEFKSESFRWDWFVQSLLTQKSLKAVMKKLLTRERTNCSEKREHTQTAIEFSRILTKLF